MKTSATYGGKTTASDVQRSLQGYRMQKFHLRTILPGSVLAALKFGSMSTLTTANQNVRFVSGEALSKKEGNYRRSLVCSVGLQQSLLGSSEPVDRS